MANLQSVGDLGRPGWALRQGAGTWTPMLRIRGDGNEGAGVQMGWSQSKGYSEVGIGERAVHGSLLNTLA